MRSNLKAALAAAVVISPVLVAAPATANTIYTYTGNNFTVIFAHSSPPAGSYTTSMNVTGSFTLGSSLLPNLSNADITASLLSYSFFDGRGTIDESDTLFFKNVTVSTDLAGNISTWSVALSM